jgi:hypothetical protein
MDMTQLAQSIKWLEEGQARDKAEIERLGQQLAATQSDLVDQAKKVKDLEGRLAAAHAQLSRAGQVEIAMEKARKEVALLIQQHEVRVQAAERELLGARQSERESSSKAIEDLRIKVQSYDRFDKPIEIQRTEIARLNEVLSTLAHQSSEDVKAVRERLQGLAYLEDMIRRNERNIAQLQTLDAELRRQQNLVTEALQKSDFERVRQMAAWQEEFKAQRTSLEALAPRITALQEHQDSGRRLVSDMKKVEERLQLQQDQVRETQRLAEERQKRELGEWQAENEKRWKRLEVMTEQQWNRQATEHEQAVARLKVLEQQLAHVVNQVDWLWRVQRASAYHNVSEVQKWITDFEALLEERDKAEPGAARDAAARGASRLDGAPGPAPVGKRG